MFDLSFLELLVIGVVALVVVGPERLPTIARAAGRLMGRFQRFMNSMAEDLNREMEIDKLKAMHEDAKRQMEMIDQKAKEGAAQVQETVETTARQVESAGQDLAAAATTESSVADGKEATAISPSSNDPLS